MNKLFLASSSPHIHTKENIPLVMRRVILAMLPLVASSMYFFGLCALLLLLVCTATSLSAEAFFQKLRRQPITLSDGSAVITGMLLAFTLPPAWNGLLWRA